ncbi:MAG TPA: hypothetical protein VN228_03720, partial [Pyrinomonadaceae bacterium]|nr:hypothetical protein [Pyrinomonadaceae bacterium]
MRGESVEQGAARVRRRWLWWLVGGRVLAAGLLLGVGLLWSESAAAGPPAAGRPGATLALALAVLALSGLYALALRFSRIRLETQAGVQFALDILLITWLVWVTGDIYSPYSALYIVVVAAASVFLGSRGALLTSVGCAVSYTAAMFSLASGLLPGGGGAAGSSTLPKVTEAVGLSVAAYLAVGLLAARL